MIGFRFIELVRIGTLGVISVLSAAWSAGVQAQTPPPHLQQYFGPVKQDPAFDWVDRIARSARELPYAGVFVHQALDRSSTSRITHVVDRQGVEHEKVESLDGPLTEVIRRNDEMICYQPSSKTIKVERRVSGRFFPGLITANARTIAENYHARLGPVERVAGHECQWVILEPKDALRYMQKLCAELGTGLLLRAQMLNNRQQVIEQFMFTQVDVSGNVARQPIRSRFEQLQGWQREHAARAAQALDSLWHFANVPAGFRKVMEMSRNLAGRPAPVSHMVFSDGVLNVSVFIENSSGNPISAQAVVAEDGPTAVVTRALGDGHVTVMGEVPVAAAQVFAEGIRRR
ncbi:MAG TPA: MucB/RseB C-terminal domain-containing protein [Usitatibacteraceae bacterium]|nr:MucB/RseB C-terminal domain-containing protein [Usitatibacteraceae bacterium]